MYPEPRYAHNWLIKRLLNVQVRSRLPEITGAVIDLGCGTRPFEADIMASATSYLGVDWGNSLHGSHADVVADLNTRLPLESGIADHVVSFEVMEHLAEPNVMLSEAHRILRSGGRLTLSVPFQWWVHEAPYDYYRYTCHGLEHMLTKAGFYEIKVRPTSGFWSMMCLKLNYQLIRLVRGPKPLRVMLRAFLIPFWFTGQTVSPLLDRYWREPRETAGYFVTARKR
ncbi:class I SAM-dependent methyltransferase [Luteimonas sp. A501]